LERRCSCGQAGGRSFAFLGHDIRSSVTQRAAEYLSENQWSSRAAPRPWRNAYTRRSHCQSGRWRRGGWTESSSETTDSLTIDDLCQLLFQRKDREAEAVARVHVSDRCHRGYIIWVAQGCAALPELAGVQK